MKTPPKRVKAPSGCSQYLTAGKEYEVVEIHFKKDEKHGSAFSILDDDGVRLYCLEFCCHFINRQDWIIIEREPETNEK